MNKSDIAERVKLLNKASDAYYNKNSPIKMCIRDRAYAISTHKSQGGQFKVVVLITPKAHTFMLNSNLLYVGESLSLIHI